MDFAPNRERPAANGANGILAGALHTSASANLERQIGPGAAAGMVVEGDGRRSRGPSSLVQRNVSVGLRRTTVRLEPAMWDALGEICEREKLSLNDLCGRIAGRRSASSLTAAVRVFVMSYFRAAATEDGHIRTGHGQLYGDR